MKQFFISILLGLTALAIPFQVLAFEIRNSDIVVIDKDTTVSGTLFAGGTSVTVDGTVNGDIFCAGERVAIHGTVNGDVLCAGQSIVIDGIVHGNIRSAGQSVDLSGIVERNVSVAGQTITTQKEMNVKGDMLFAGQTVGMNGAVAKSLAGAGQAVRLDSVVGGDVLLTLENLDIGSNANVAGKLTYTSKTLAQRDPHAIIKGEVSHQLPKESSTPSVQKEQSAPRSGAFWLAKLLGSILFYLVIGFLLVWIVPKQVVSVTTHLIEHPVLDIGIGLVVLVAAPIVIILTCITIIGIPLGILFGLIYGFALFISRLFVAIVVGQKAFNLAHRPKTSLTQQMLVGVGLSWVVYSIPVLGFLLAIIAVAWGVGGITYSLLHRGATK